jgi:hypothetical protein
MATFSDKLFDQIGPRALVIPGLVIVVVSLSLFTWFDEATDTLCMDSTINSKSPEGYQMNK